MSAPLLGDYVPGSTWLHRSGAGWKLSALALLSLAVVLIPGWWTGLVALGVVLLLCHVAGVGPRRILRTLAALSVIALALVAYSLWRGTWQVALEQVADLFALVLASVVLTTTTAVDEILDVVVRLLTPLRRFGVNPERVAHAFSLVLRSVPMVVQLARETRDAARARGLERNPRAWLTPFVVRSVAHARDTGDALHARGLGDD